jgi:hypothetical protein
VESGRKAGVQPLVIAEVAESELRQMHTGKISSSPTTQRVYSNVKIGLERICCKIEHSSDESISG